MRATVFMLSLSMLSRTLAALVVGLSLPGVVVWHQPGRAEAVGQACDGCRDQPQRQVCPRRRQGPASR